VDGKAGSLRVLLDAIEHRRPDGREQAGSRARLDHHDLEQPIPCVAPVRHGQIELDSGEIDDEHGDALGFDRLAIEYESEARVGRG